MSGDSICDKQNIKNYRPVSLLSICVKIFESLFFNEMFNYFSAIFLINKDLLSNRKQRAVLNGQNSSWTNVHAGV